MPSTTAKATRRSAKRDESSIQRSAQSAFLRTHGTVSSALKRCIFSALSRTYVSMSSEYVSLCTFSIMIWKP